MNCPKCNKEYDESLDVCPFCGEPKNDTIAQATQEDNNTLTKENSAPDNSAENSDEQNLPQTQAEEQTPAAGDQSTIDENFGVAASTTDVKIPEEDKTRQTRFIITIVIATVVAVALILLVIFGLNSNNNGQDKKGFGNGSSISATDANGSAVEYATNSDGTVATNPDGTPVILSGSSSATTANGQSSQGSSSNSTSSNSADSNLSSGASSSAASSGVTASSAGGSDTSNNSSDNSQAAQSSASDSSTSDSDSSVTINGTKFNVGDTVRVTVNLNGVSEAVLGLNATVDYNGTMLDIVADSDKYPNLPGCVSNVNTDGKIYFNAATARGWDFSGDTVLMTVDFKISDSSVKSDDIKLTLEELYGQGEKEEDIDDILKSDYKLILSVAKA